MRIRYCSSPCGSGKTHQIINIASEQAKRGKKSLVLQPTRELIEKTVSQIRARPEPPEVFVFHRDKVGDGGVAKALAEHIKDCPAFGQIVFATHAVLPHVKFLARRDEWQVFVDEELQVVKHQVHNMPDTHGLITDHLRLEQVNAIYARVLVGNAVLEDIAKNEGQDEIFETLADTTRILVNPQWETCVNLEQFERLRAGEARQLAFHSVLKPSVFDGFDSVFMTSANFETQQSVKSGPNEGCNLNRTQNLARAFGILSTKMETL